MFKKTLCQLQKHLTLTSSTHFKSLHSNSPKNLKQFLNFPSTEIALQACCDHGLVRQGKQVHAQLVVNGGTKNNLLGTKLLAICLELGFASPWNWMIRGFTNQDVGLWNFT
ncbi:hypothetical protein F8388_008186 [Cannabis sativa]|uniref:Uncharacterized protein n=1 Tax=Cannabis sativa TaxID=3483 RepID=A0A7J6H7M2_CANSA|nr:hypothetical protein F8388_008186 [Cannabis sativa]KAF4391286.1 hypothetical protein G4B88_016596 [Cannabis sativa]